MKFTWHLNIHFIIYIAIHVQIYTSNACGLRSSLAVTWAIIRSTVFASKLWQEWLWWVSPHITCDYILHVDSWPRYYSSRHHFLFPTTQQAADVSFHSYTSVAPRSFFDARKTLHLTSVRVRFEFCEARQTWVSIVTCFNFNTSLPQVSALLTCPLMVPRVQLKHEEAPLRHSTLHHSAEQTSRRHF